MTVRTAGIASAVAVLFFSGCVAGPRTAVPSNTPGSLAPSPATRVWSAEDADITLSVTFDQPSVPSGGSIVASVVVSNASSRPITYLSNGCGVPAILKIAVPIPNDSSGSAQVGSDGAFKQYVLTTGYGQGGQPALAPVQASFGPVCPNPPTDLEIAAGKSVSAQVAWTADVIPGVPAPAGPLAVTATTSYDPAPFPSPVDPTNSIAPESPGTLRAPPGMRIERYLHQVATSGVLNVTGGASAMAVLSAAQAVDAALVNQSFSDWVSRQPSSTWVNANLYLDKRGWHVELFVVPRAFGLVLLDPVTGSVRSVQICAAPSCNQ